MAKDLQRKVLNARMVEGRATNTDERARLLRESMNIQMEMTRRNQDLQKLRAEIAALENPNPAAAAAAAAAEK